MPRSNFTLPIVFGTLSGNVSASTLDQDFNAIGSIVSDSAAGWANVATDSGTTNQYIVTLNPPAAEYINGFFLSFLPLNQNTSASSINVNNLGSVPILELDGSSILPQRLLPGVLFTMMFVNNAFRIVSPGQPDIGEIKAFAFQPVANNWINADGRAVSRNSFSALFSKIGTSFGAGDGATTFNVPNVLNRFLTHAAPGLTGGSNLSTIATINLPAHNHVINVSDPPHQHTCFTTPHAHVDAGHTHSVLNPVGTVVGVTGGASNIPAVSGNVATATGFAQISQVGNIGAISSANATGITATSSNTGSGTPLNVTNAWLGSIYAIRAY